MTGSSSARIVVTGMRIDDREEAETPVKITGRIPGFLAWLLTLLGLSPAVSFTVTAERAELSSSSVSGVRLRTAPLSDVSHVSVGHVKPIGQLVIAIVLVLVAVAVLTSRERSMSPVPLGLAVFFFVRYSLRKTTFFLVDAGRSSMGLLLQRSVIEGVSLDVASMQRIADRIQRCVRRATPREAAVELPFALDDAAALEPMPSAVVLPPEGALPFAPPASGAVRVPAAVAATPSPARPGADPAPVAAPRAHAIATGETVPIAVDPPARPSAAPAAPAPQRSVTRPAATPVRVRPGQHASRSGVRVALGVLALLLTAAGAGGYWLWAHPEVVVSNTLGIPVSASIGAAAPQALMPGATLTTRTPRTAALEVRWRAEPPLRDGIPVGDPVVATSRAPFAKNPLAPTRLALDLRASATPLFAPRITNETEQPLRVTINAGLTLGDRSLARDCDCTIPPHAVRQPIGFYPLYQNSTVRVTDPSSASATFEELGAKADPRTGVVSLLFRSQDLR